MLSPKSCNVNTMWWSSKKSDYPDAIEELAIGAVAEDGQIFLDKGAIAHYFNPRQKELTLY